MQPSGELFSASHLATIMRFVDSIGPVLDSFKRTICLLGREYEKRCYARTDLQPSLRHALACYPYGKSVRGKKRWLLEMKQALHKDQGLAI